MITLDRQVVGNNDRAGAGSRSVQADVEQRELARSLGPVELAWREWRWIGIAPAHIVVAAPDSAAWRRLMTEAAVMERFRSAAGPVVPRVFVADPELRVQIRERADGATGWEIERIVFGTDVAPAAAERYRPGCPLTAGGARLATELGRALARFHAAIAPATARRFGVAEPDRAAIAARAETVALAHARDGGLLARAVAQAAAWVEALGPERVVVHGDPHLFNVFVDPAAGALRTIIDYDEIHLGHRAEDLRYLHSCGIPFARAALAAYATASGVFVDEATVGRYHAVGALEHLAFVAPDAPRFSEIVAWATAAVAAFAPDWT